MGAPSSPFPGMDPYLEEAGVWPDFHDTLAVTLKELLNAVLPPPYYSRVQVRPEVGIILEAGSFHRIIPDAVVLRHPAPPGVRETRAAYADLTEPRTQVTAGIEARVNTEPVRHPYIEIRDPTHDHKLITLIEIVSPSNKRPGPDRRAYETKQRDVLDSDANLIEIDLLRSGRRLLPYPELENVVYQLACDYLVLLNRNSGRAGLWMDFTLFPVNVREILPCIPAPLAGHDADVPLDLQIAVERTYRAGLYLRSIDYAAPPDPPLDDANAAWAEELLRRAGLRAEVT